MEETVSQNPYVSSSCHFIKCGKLAFEKNKKFPVFFVKKKDLCQRDTVPSINMF